MLERHVKKAQALQLMGALGGLVAGQPRVIGANLLGMTKTQSYSMFAKVKSVKRLPRWHTLKVNQLLEKNQVYVDPVDFEAVYHFIVSRCPRLKKP